MNLAAPEGELVTPSSKFVLSLDFELMWGVRDHADIISYGANVLGERAAVLRMLDLFERHGIRATWATVGFVFCEGKDELIASAPALRPSYVKAGLSNYGYFPEVGDSEKSDPYYFGASLIDRIRSCPGQEIGSHSFSHYYCLEAGQTLAQFDADIEAAIAIARRRGITLKSFVFPRNQYSDEHLGVLSRKGFKVFRGNERAWLYRPTDGAGQSKIRRAWRLADNYANLTGHHVHGEFKQSGLVETPASRFLRPYSRMLAPLDPLRLHRITSAMDEAARTGNTFHLWWHPHNFGVHVNDNIEFLTLILAHFSKHKDRHGMISANMGDFA
jgi:peptidoglycan/xylan/chitin deacetylase (PgdA/CDA1 family)